jgi:Haemolysin secretion/activation protein ShlB/FhaC/HecB
MIKQLPLLLLLSILFGCNTTRKAFYHEEEVGWAASQLPDSSLLEHTVFMAGGAGEGNAADSLLPWLGQQFQQAGKQSTLVFLGDNVPARSGNSSKHSVQAKLLLDKQIAVAKGSPGQVVFLPGDNDWEGGCEAIEWQKAYLTKALGNDRAFLPGNCCGEPEKLKMSDNARLLFADSQWWLRPNNKEEDGCNDEGHFGYLQAIEKDLKKQEKARIVLFMHHPMRSNGLHGGSYSWRHHLFPLTMWKKKAWLPLPGVGSLAVLFRRMGGHRQDLTSYEQTLLRSELLRIVHTPPRNESVIFVGAQDQSLQLFTEVGNVNQFIVSGSMAGAAFATGGKEARFVQARQGFAKLYFYENRAVWVEFLALSKQGGKLETVFRKQLYQGSPIVTEAMSEAVYAPLSDSITIAASEVFKGSDFKKIALGNRYRDAWSQPIRVPVFDLNDEYRHLKIVEEGGGRTTRSLRLEANDGKQYVLRSLFKDVRRGKMSTFMYNTVLEDITADLKSGLHPYSALAVPRLADAAGIYHTNPKVVFLAAQPRLAPYNEGHAGGLYLFEERPDDDNWADAPNFGNSKEIVGTQDLLAAMAKSHKHRPDADWTLRSRLFDLWINDTDRHDDQWRWAKLPQPDSTTLYRPIPRDRDQAFYDLRGILPFIGSRRWMPKSSRGFHRKIWDVPGQSRSAGSFDRSFLSPLDHEAWMQTAQKLQASLTDEAIEAAFAAWPPEVYQYNAVEMMDILKARRNSLVKDAKKLYRFLSKYVNVVGTNKKDRFEVVRSSGGETEVSVFDLKKDGSKGDRFFHRVFKKSETKEIRLYGLDAGDEFHLSGKAGRGILVRIIGGDGKDEVADESSAGVFRKKTIVYDTPDGMDEKGDEICDLRSNRLKVNEYNRSEFRYNSYLPSIQFGRTVDDGLLLGGGVSFTRYRFRKLPYGSRHQFAGRTSLNTNAINLRYVGDFVKSVGNLDFNPEIRFDRPIIFNFFGLGNDSRDTATSSQFNWVRMEKLAVQPLLKKTWFNGRNTTRLGPFFEKVEVENRAGRITDTDALPPGSLAQRRFAGLIFQHDYSAVDQGAIPRNGIKLHVGATYYRNLSDGLNYTRTEGNLTTYVTVGSKMELTIATRIGGAALSNDDFLFYHSNNLGGNSFLRGFRNNRFAGRALFYHNTDLRWKLFFVKNRVAPFDFGLTTGLDYGRVWSGKANGGKLHSGFSPGFWIAPYKLAALTAFYTFTDGSEDNTYTIRIGFFF